MNRKLILTSAAVASCMALAVAAPTASAATDAVSENWAGYEATNGSSDFSAASGSWVQPTAKCPPGSPSYSAFWVGLGGGSQGWPKNGDLYVGVLEAVPKSHMGDYFSETLWAKSR